MAQPLGRSQGAGHPFPGGVDLEHRLIELDRGEQPTPVSGQRQSVRPPVRIELNGGYQPARPNVDDRDGSAGILAVAVVRDVGEATLGIDHHLAGAAADCDRGVHAQSSWIHERHRVIGGIDHQQGAPGSSARGSCRGASSGSGLARRAARAAGRAGERALGAPPRKRPGQHSWPKDQSRGRRGPGDRRQVHEVPPRHWVSHMVTRRDPAGSGCAGNSLSRGAWIGRRPGIAGRAYAGVAVDIHHPRRAQAGCLWA